VSLMVIGLLAIIVAIIALLVMWVIVSVPVYLSAKAFTGGRSTLGEAMAATFLGALVYAIVSWMATVFLAALMQPRAGLLGALLAFLALLWVYKSTFKIGWLQAFGIAVLAVIIMAVIVAILGGLALIPFLIF